MNFTDSKITEIYFLVDEFNQQFQKELAVHIVGNPAKRPPILSSSEVITIMIPLLYNIDRGQLAKSLMHRYQVEGINANLTTT